MFSIILLYTSTNNINDIINYVTHINNINFKNNKIDILILNCNNKIINNNNINKISPNITLTSYNFIQQYNDSFYNDIINNVKTDKILFSNLDILLTDTVIDWITNTNLDNESFVKTNTFFLNNISQQFYNNFNNDIYNNIIDNIVSVSNEKGVFNIDKTTFVEIFNKNKYINTIEHKDIIENNIHFLHSSQDFLLINKNTITKIGFNSKNNNPNYTFQYVILQLIQNNHKMIKLPYIISIYKLLNSEYNDTIIDKNNKVNTDSTYNKYSNYTVLNLLTNKTKSVVRNQIKKIKGYNTADTVTENKNLKNKILKLENTICELQKNKSSNHKSEIDVKKYNSLELNYKTLELNFKHILEKYNNLEKKHKNSLDEIEKTKNNFNTTKQKNVLLKLYDIINSDIDIINSDIDNFNQ